MANRINEKEAFYEKIIGFFDQRVLASYRSEPDRYVLETDHFEGHLQAVVDDQGVPVAAGTSTSDSGIAHVRAVILPWPYFCRISLRNRLHMCNNGPPII